MKVTNTIFAFAYASVSLASVNYVGTAPLMPTPVPALPSVQPIPTTPIPVIVADFTYSPAVPMPPASSAATPAVPSAQPLVPAPAVGYVASSAPNVPGASVVPANPSAQPEPSMTAWPAPAPSYRADITPKREVDQTAIESLVSGTGAMLFNANNNSYVLVRLPADLARSVSQSKAALRKRSSESGLLDNIGKVVAEVKLPVIANIGISNPDEDGGLGGLLKRDLLDNLLGEVVASAVAPLNIVANINPDEDGNGLLPNLLGRVSATIQASPTVTAHIFDSGSNGGLLKRDLLENLLGEIVASAVAPLNIVANINPDEDGNGLLPNLLGRVSATIQASPTVTAHIFDSGSSNNGLFKKDAMPNGIYTERIDDTHVAIYIPLSSLVKTKGQSAVSSLVSVAGSGNVQIVNMSPTPTMPVSSAPTPATTTMPGDNIYLRLVVPASSLV
ncbi:hypothetical protein GGF42_002903 [Coemansia sp. RSA 2424]|nr:hypothetical protein GGF42_002903 [Coemansia sp. RSA 2424]